MKVQELIQALDQVGQVYRSKDGRKPADAIAKLNAQLQGFEHLSLAEWVVLRSTGTELSAPKHAIPVPQELQAILVDLERAADDCTSQAAFQKLDALKLSADNWKKLARLATGRASQSGKAAKDALRSHLANQAQLHNRRDSIDRLFP
ncbi:MAG: hypothetical protein ACLPX9_22410 [Rhodomicrobium sp.]